MVCKLCGYEGEWFYKNNRSVCKRCLIKRSISWFNAHPEKVREYSDRFRRKHPRYDAERHKRTYVPSPRVLKDPKRLWRVKLRETYAGPQEPTDVDWLIRGIRFWVFLVLWCRKEVRRLRDRSRERRKRRINGGRKAKIKKWLLKKQKGMCIICREQMKEIHLDHILPKARGGTNNRKNLQLLCATCNQLKSDRDSHEFMQENGYLL